MTTDPVSALTLEQKAALLSGDGDWHTLAIPEIGLPAAELGDGPHGLRKETGIDMVWIPSTGFPTASALAATWDRELVGRVAAAIAEEARALGVQLVLGPGVNLKRTPLCGRNFEYFSEDPLLTAELASAYIRGMQGKGVGACLKHFAANNQETERTEISVEADERTLRELYLEGFRATIAASDPWAVMCSYNRIGGVHASQHRWLLTTVLREEWGYQGAVVSDWDAVHDPVAAVAAGLDLEMPGTDGRSAAAIVQAVRDGRLAEAAVDAAARRVVALVERLLPDGQVIDGSVPSLGIVPGELSGEQVVLLGAEAHHKLAREAAGAAITLLRNEGGTLPLDRVSGDRIAVIGGYARVPRIQGGGSSGVDPVRVDSPLDALRALAGERIDFADGYPVAATDFYQEWPAETPVDEAALRAEAVELARSSDVVVAFVGLPLSAEVEATDRHDLELPAAQVALLDELQELGKPLVVVLAAGSAVSLDPWHDGTDAILLTWLGGEGVGNAVASVLFGEVEPSGRLSETYPLRVEDTPGYATFPGADGRVAYDEGVFIGYRWYDAKGLAVRYPFGHGLSYTRFSYGEPVLVVDEPDRVLVEVVVTNTGRRHGAEVVQAYVEPPQGEVPRPVRELRGFEKVWLEPGESRVVRFGLAVRDFAWVDASAHCWRQTAGTYRVAVGSSSRHLHGAVAVERPAATVALSSP